MIQAPTWFSVTALLVAAVAPLVWGAAAVWITCRLTSRPSPFPTLPTFAEVVKAVRRMPAPQADTPEEPPARVPLRDRVPSRIRP